LKVIRLAPAAFLFAMVLAAISLAQSPRTFVSGQGKDKNPCSQTSPCRTFTQAIAQTAAGGAVIALDSGSYAPFAINKAITVEAPGGAAITVASGDGIDVSAGVSDIVIIRGLTVNNQGSSGNGIVFKGGGTLHIERSVANGFSGFGMSGISITSPANIFVKDTIARNNYNGLALNIATGAPATATITMDQLHLDANRIGLFVQTQTGQTVTGTIGNSSASGNSDAGILVNANAGGSISLNVESCLLTNTSIGLIAESSTAGSAAAYISFCSIAHNAVNGFEIGGQGAIFSRGNNTLIDNGQNVGSLTTLVAQ